MRRTAEVALATSLVLTACGREALHADGEGVAPEDIPVATEPGPETEALTDEVVVTTVPGAEAVGNVCVLEFDPGAPFYFSDEELTEVDDVRIPVGEVSAELLEPFRDPIDRHIHPDFQAIGPEVFSQQFDCEFGLFNGVAGTNFRDETYIEMHLNSDAEPIPSEILESIIMHENAHIFLFMVERYAEEDQAIADQLGEYTATWIQLMQRLSPDVEEAVNEWLVSDGMYLEDLVDVIHEAAPKDSAGYIKEPSSGPLAVLDESSYFGVDGGHPYTEAHELFASTLNLALRFPDALMEASQQQGEIDEYLTKQAVRQTLDLFADFSVQSRDAALAEFPEAFVEYFYS